jgi:type IV pilus assembly protein PilX
MNRLHRLPQRERGATLIIALIVLVAMTLAGVAMMRSVDTATVVAGNIAFKQSTVNAADQGLQTGYAWLASAPIVDAPSTLYTTDTSVGYISAVPGTDPDWMDNNNWSNAKSLNGGSPDASGNVVSFLVHRMCPVADCAPDATCLGNVNTCGSTPDSTLITGEGIDQSKPNYFTRPPAIHYRISSRAVGPRNSITVVQTMVKIQ